MPRPFLKICGLRRLSDLFRALELGARYCGMIVEAPGSPRSLSLEEAARLAAYIPGKIVAVVRDLPEARLREVLDALQPAAVQLHGHEPPALVAALRVAFPEVEVWRALGVPPRAEERSREVARLGEEAEAYAEAGAGAVLLDTAVAGGSGQAAVSGGTGSCCDWEAAAELARSLPLPVILAGGLGPDNLVAAARTVAPAGMDVSSGVEESPGVKSADALERLFREWGRLG
jgi:phosphoribosylanthranilate isomerase